jgi:hypothetical protein
MIETDSASNLEFDSLELICYLACLREAASAKAGAWNLVLFPAMLYAFSGWR